VNVLLCKRMKPATAIRCVTSFRGFYRFENVWAGFKPMWFSWQKGLASGGSISLISLKERRLNATAFVILYSMCAIVYKQIVFVLFHSVVALCGLRSHICVRRKPSICPRNPYMRSAKTIDKAEKLIYVSQANALLWPRNTYMRSANKYFIYSLLENLCMYISTYVYNLTYVWIKSLKETFLLKRALVILSDYRGSDSAPRVQFTQNRPIRKGLGIKSDRVPTAYRSVM
jgi:hypothetical protein